MRTNVLIALTLTALGTPAIAGRAVFEAVGTVASLSGGGVFAGTAVGTPARFTFEVITPGTDVTPGQYTNYAIDTATVVVTIGTISTGCSGGTPVAGMRNAHPVADGIILGPVTLTGTAPLNFSFSECSGAIFTSTDPVQNVGTWNASLFCSYDWSIAGPGTFMEITPLTFSIYLPEPGEAFCFGDGIDATHTTPCPCANTGGPGRGCANSANATGALLDATGDTSSDNVVLQGSGMPATVSCIYLQGDALDDMPFGDGVRCAGGTLLRMRTKANVGGASSFPDSTDTITLAQRGGVTIGSGVRRYYQTYYRNAAPLYCPPETFNVTNGYLLDW